jgi:hypothetical protein
VGSWQRGVGQGWFVKQRAGRGLWGKGLCAWMGHAKHAAGGQAEGRQEPHPSHLQRSRLLVLPLLMKIHHQLVPSTSKPGRLIVQLVRQPRAPSLSIWRLWWAAAARSPPPATTPLGCCPLLGHPPAGDSSSRLPGRLLLAAASEVTLFVTAVTGDNGIFPAAWDMVVLLLLAVGRSHGWPCVQPSLWWSRGAGLLPRSR